MKTFFINYVLNITEYMQDGSKKENRTILVEAENEEKAKETLKKYWEDKSDTYSTSYDVWDYEIAPTISQTEVLK